MSYGAVWCDFYIFFVVIDVFLRGLVVIWLSAISCDNIEVKLDQSLFVFGVVLSFML